MMAVSHKNLPELTINFSELFIDNESFKKLFSELSKLSLYLMGLDELEKTKLLEDAYQHFFKKKLYQELESALHQHPRTKNFSKRQQINDIKTYLIKRTATITDNQIQKTLLTLIKREAKKLRATPIIMGLKESQKNANKFLMDQKLAIKPQSTWENTFKLLDKEKSYIEKIKYCFNWHEVMSGISACLILSILHRTVIEFLKTYASFETVKTYQESWDKTLHVLIVIIPIMAIIKCYITPSTITISFNKLFEKTLETEFKKLIQDQKALESKDMSYPHPIEKTTPQDNKTHPKESTIMPKQVFHQAGKYVSNIIKFFKPQPKTTSIDECKPYTDNQGNWIIHFSNEHGKKYTAILPSENISSDQEGQAILTSFKKGLLKKSRGNSPHSIVHHTNGFKIRTSFDGRLYSTIANDDQLKEKNISKDAERTYLLFNNYVRKHNQPIFAK